MRIHASRARYSPPPARPYSVRAWTITLCGFLTASSAPGGRCGRYASGKFPGPTPQAGRSASISAEPVQYSQRTCNVRMGSPPRARPVATTPTVVATNTTTAAMTSPRRWRPAHRRTRYSTTAATAATTPDAIAPVLSVSHQAHTAGTTNPVDTIAARGGRGTCPGGPRSPAGAGASPASSHLSTARPAAARASRTIVEPYTLASDQNPLGVCSRRRVSKPAASGESGAKPIAARRCARLASKSATCSGISTYDWYKPCSPRVAASATTTTSTSRLCHAARAHCIASTAATTRAICSIAAISPSRRSGARRAEISRQIAISNAPAAKTGCRTARPFGRAAITTDHPAAIARITQAEATRRTL